MFSCYNSLFEKTSDREVFIVKAPRCFRPFSNSTKRTSQLHLPYVSLECSRQSVLYVLEQLLPDKTITVKTIKTVMQGADKCCFHVTIE